MCQSDSPTPTPEPEAWGRSTLISSPCVGANDDKITCLVWQVTRMALSESPLWGCGPGTIRPSLCLSPDRGLLPLEDGQAPVLMVNDSWGEVEGGSPAWPDQSGVGVGAWEDKGISGTNATPESGRQGWSCSEVASEASTGVLDRDFCQPRNTQGVGEAATGNKTSSVPGALGGPGGLRQPTGCSVEI